MNIEEWMNTYGVSAHYDSGPEKQRWYVWHYCMSDKPDTGETLEIALRKAAKNGGILLDLNPNDQSDSPPPNL